jgi:hypothetical protein
MILLGFHLLQGRSKIGEASIEEISRLVMTPSEITRDLLDRQIEKIQFHHLAPRGNELIDGLPDGLFEGPLLDGFPSIGILVFGNPLLSFVMIKAFFSAPLSELVYDGRANDLLDVRGGAIDGPIFAQQFPDSYLDLLKNILRI